MIDRLTPYKVVNKLYKANFSLYRIVYFLYKRFSEKNEISFIRKSVRPGMAVIDVGANIGFYTLLLSDLVGPKGKVFSFEPERQNFGNLKRICQNRKNISLYNFAVGNKNGFINLYKSNDLNVDHITYDNGEKRKKLRVKCISLDNFFGKRKLDFIKVDTQGYEYNVLMGGRGIIMKHKHLVFLAEFSPYDISRAGNKPKDLLNKLKSFGLTIRYLEKDYKRRIYGKNPDALSYVNLTAVK